MFSQGQGKAATRYIENKGRKKKNRQVANYHFMQTRKKNPRDAGEHFASRLRQHIAWNTKENRLITSLDYNQELEWHQRQGDVKYSPMLLVKQETRNQLTCQFSQITARAELSESFSNDDTISGMKCYFLFFFPNLIFKWCEPPQMKLNSPSS